MYLRSRVGNGLIDYWRSDFHRKSSATFGYTLIKKMNLPVKAALATLLHTPIEFII